MFGYPPTIPSEDRRGIVGYSLRKKEEILAFQFLLPTLLVIAVIIIYPLIFNIWISFHRVTLISIGENNPFAGNRNFCAVFQNQEYLPVLWVNVFYAVTSSFFAMLLGLWAALIINQRFRGRGLVRGIFLFPYVAPVIALAFVWRWILNPLYGVGNYFLISLGVTDVGWAWLSERPLALIAVIAFQAWRYFPFCMLLTLARLQAIPQEFFEVGDVEGASNVQKFFYIILPELRSTLGVIFLLRFMWSFNKFDDIYLLTGGAAGTKTLPIMVYNLGFEVQNLGEGAACSMVLFLILIISLPIYIKRVLRW